MLFDGLVVLNIFEINHFMTSPQFPVAKLMQLIKFQNCSDCHWSLSSLLRV